MTNKSGNEYDWVCPDDQHDAFAQGAQKIVDIALWSYGVRRSISPPSRVKAELKQFSKVLRNLSLEAQSSLWLMGAHGSSFSPISYLIEQVENALIGIADGRPETDEVRHYLGTHAAALWCSHGGDLQASEFEDFLETLINNASSAAVGNVRIDKVALAEQMRCEYKNCNPQRWPRP